MSTTKITYTITEALQRAEIAAGRDGARARTIDVDLTPLIEDTKNIHVNPDGTLTYLQNTDWDRDRSNNHIYINQPTLLTPETALDAIDAEIAIAEKEKEKKILAWLALPDAEKIDDRGLTNWRVCEYSRPDHSDPRVVAEVARLKKICDEHNTIVIDEKKAREEKAEKETIELKQRKTAQLAEAVARLGTETQRERWIAGVMPRSEALGLIRAELVAPLIAAGFAPIIGVWAINSDCMSIDEDEDNTACEETEKKTLTDEQWIMAKKIMACLPDVAVSYWHQYQTGDNADPDEVCDLVRLSKKIGEYNFEIDIIL
jgi:hypothetical protein